MLVVTSYVTYPLRAGSKICYRPAKPSGEKGVTSSLVLRLIGRGVGGGGGRAGVLGLLLGAALAVRAPPPSG
jgi:hypothetical protein